MLNGLRSIDRCNVAPAPYDANLIMTRKIVLMQLRLIHLQLIMYRNRKSFVEKNII